MLSQKAPLFLFLILCTCFFQVLEAVRLGLPITERGTKFIQRVSIKNKKTATFHVPAHNDVEKSDVLMDYEQKLSVTRIPRLKECHVEKMDDQESSPEKLLADIAKLKFIHDGKPESVLTVKKTVIKVGKFTTPSSAMVKFCRKFPMFKMSVIDAKYFTTKPQGHRIQKRSSNPFRKLKKYFDSINWGEDQPPVDDDREDDTAEGEDDTDDDDDDDDSGSSSSGSSGYMPPRRVAAARQGVVFYSSEILCKGLRNYDLNDCISSPPEQWNLTRVDHAHTCMYQVKCRKPVRQTDGRITPGECFEHHSSSREICYDVSCKESNLYS